jgi:hypothetical protein
LYNTYRSALLDDLTTTLAFQTNSGMLIPSVAFLVLFLPGTVPVITKRLAPGNLQLSLSKRSVIASTVFHTLRFNFILIGTEFIKVNVENIVSLESLLYSAGNKWPLS